MPDDLQVQVAGATPAVDAGAVGTVAVGTALAGGPPHRSVRAALRKRPVEYTGRRGARWATGRAGQAVAGCQRWGSSSARVSVR